MPTEGLKRVRKGNGGLEGSWAREAENSEGRGTTAFCREDMGRWKSCCWRSSCWKKRYEPAAIRGRTKFLPKIAWNILEIVGDLHCNACYLLVKCFVKSMSVST